MVDALIISAAALYRKPWFPLPKFAAKVRCQSSWPLNPEIRSMPRGRLTSRQDAYRRWFGIAGRFDPLLWSRTRLQRSDLSGVALAGICGLQHRRADVCLMPVSH